MNKPAKNTPFHYLVNGGVFDVIDICKAYALNFNRGNVVKYICRAGKKQNELEDLYKAKEYIEREISFIEQHNEKFKVKLDHDPSQIS